MPETISTLLYGSAIDISGLEKSARAAREQIKSIGDFATKTFDQSISRTLANSVQPAELTAGVARAKGILGSLGIDVSKNFERTLGRNLARQTLKPFVEESSTFLGQLKQGFTSTLGVGRVALGVGLGNILADVVRGLGNAAKEAINLAAQFELGLAKVQTIADRGFNVDQVGKQLLELSTRIPQTATSLAEGLFGIIGSGIKETSDALSVLETSAKAAVAGVSSTAAAAKSIVFVLNAYGKSAEEAAHISDILFKTVDEGVIEFNDLAANIGDVVGPAALAKASIEDVAAGIATMTKAGISAAESTTALRRLIGEIVSPSEKASRAAKQLGIDLSQAGIQAAGGFRQFIQQIAEITKGDVTKLREIFPEERAFRAISILAGTMAGEFERLGIQFNNLNEVTGATDRAFKVINETAAFQFKLFKNNLAVAVTDLGQGFINFLLPALKDINELFDDTSPLDKTISRMKELGVEAEKIEMLTLRSSLIKTQEQLKNLQAELDRTVLSLQNAEESFVALSQAGAGDEGRTIAFARGVELATEQFAKQLSTVGGLIAAEEKRTALVENLGEVLSLLGTAQANNDVARTKALELTRDNLEGQITALDQLLSQQQLINAAVAQEESARRKIQLLDEFRISTEKEIQERAQAALKETETIEKQIDEAKKNRDRESEIALRKNLVAQRDIVSVAGLFVTVQRQATAATVATTDQLDKQKKAAEDAAKFIADAAKKLELLSAIDEPERRLIAIRQEADERRKQFADQAKAIEAVNRLERAEHAKTIDDFGNKLRKEVKQRIEQLVKLTIEPKLITDIKLPEIGLDEQETRTISERINRTLNEALVESPASILLNKISDLGALIDEEFINFVSIIDRRLGDLLAGIANFAEQIKSGSILGAITGVIGTIGKIFGGGDSERKRAEAERRQQLAAEESARAAEKAAQALENLRRAAEEFGAGRLIEEITKLDAEITSITDSTRKLTQEELDRAVALLEEADNLRSNISSLRALIEAYQQEGRDTTQLEEDMRQLELQLEPLAAALSDLGINLSNVTPLEIDRLKVLLEERGVLDDVINRFQAFGDGLRGLLDKLQLGFELLDTTDPAKKLEELVAALTDTFGFKIPAQFADLNEFILAGLDAVRAGGQQLIDFLIAAGIEELGAEEFADLLRTLNEFSTGVDEVGDSIADAFGDLLDKLQLEFQLLDIEDPIKQLRRLREEVARQFGAVVPETLEGIDDLVKSGLQALLAGGDALKAFLASINLEEFTEEQFRNFLESLEGLGDEAARQIEEATAAAEEITTSQVKSITFQQANKLIDEVTTIRIVVTQMLDQMRLGALANLPNIDLNNLAAALSGLNAGARSNYFIVRNGGVEKVSENQLSDIDRRLIEQARAAAQARGIN